jgi:hypothetical protein
MSKGPKLPRPTPKPRPKGVDVQPRKLSLGYLDQHQESDIYYLYKRGSYGHGVFWIGSDIEGEVIYKGVRN